MSLWAAGLAGGGNALASLFGKEENTAGNLHLVNSAQQRLWNMMYNKLRTGQGDYGFGSSVKQGKSQLAQMMSDRGIRPDSGVYNAAMGGMVADASSQDAENRSQQMFQLLGIPLQTATTYGANYIPGSPSHGVHGQDAKFYRYNQRFRSQAEDYGRRA